MQIILWETLTILLKKHVFSKHSLQCVTMLFLQLIEFWHVDRPRPNVQSSHAFLSSALKTTVFRKKNLNCLRNKEFLIFKEWNFMVLQFCPKSTKDKTSPSQKRSKSRPITSGHVVHTSWTTNQKKVLENKLRLMVSSDDISCILQKTRRRSVPTKEKPRERESGKTSNYSLSALQKVLKKIRYKFIYHAIPLQKQTNDFICSL